jgi:hypothetical protein
MERLRTALKEHGFGGVARIAWYRLRDYPQTRQAEKSAAAFDQEYSVETSKYVFLSELQDLPANREFGLWYQPTAPNLIVYVIRYLGIDPREFSFIDMGSGKGRVILTASRFPFKAVLGVEFSPDLHETAVRNIGNYTGPVATKAQSLLMDASEFRFPAGKLVIFLFNPFKGPVLDAVLKNIRSALVEASEVFIIYFVPMERAAFDSQPWLRVMRNSDMYCIYRSNPNDRGR